MMESVVEGQDKVDEILKEREIALADARKEKDEMSEELERVSARAAESDKMVENLREKIRLDKLVLLIADLFVDHD